MFLCMPDNAALMELQSVVHGVVGSVIVTSPSAPVLSVSVHLSNTLTIPVVDMTDSWRVEMLGLESLRPRL